MIFVYSVYVNNFNGMFNEISKMCYSFAYKGNLGFCSTISSLITISVETGRTMTFAHNIILVLFFCVTNTWAHSQVDIESNNLKASDHGVKLLDNNDGNLALVKKVLPGDETVRVQLYYETLCPHCISFMIHELAKVVYNLIWYMDIQTYPFGNSELILHKGEIEFKCQHGPPECYGNKLHACALDILGNHNALMYNICLMNSTSSLGSDDESADRCGKELTIDSKPIKECAKGQKGMELMLLYYSESGKVHYKHVPHVLINGNVYNSTDNDLFTDVCATFTNPPYPCKV